jgi:hypothetical protein
MRLRRDDILGRWGAWQVGRSGSNGGNLVERFLKGGALRASAGPSKGLSKSPRKSPSKSLGILHRRPLCGWRMPPGCRVFACPARFGFWLLSALAACSWTSPPETIDIYPGLSGLDPQVKSNGARFFISDLR